MEVRVMLRRRLRVVPVMSPPARRIQPGVAPGRQPPHGAIEAWPTRHHQAVHCLMRGDEDASAQEGLQGDPDQIRDRLPGPRVRPESPRTKEAAQSTYKVSAIQSP